MTQTMTETLLRYFPALDELQRARFARMTELYPEWNAKINVISRKDIDNLEVHHILHSLAIARFVTLTAGTRVLDFGCGGGFPGIPLAVMFPQVHFHLVDRIAKKLRVASEIAADLGLGNVSFQHGDIAECKEKVEFVVSRAVMPLPDLVRLCRKNISSRQINSFPNGLITLKGGNLEGELGPYRKQSLTEPVSSYFPGEPWFQDKYVTYTPIVPAR